MSGEILCKRCKLGYFYPGSYHAIARLPKGWCLDCKNKKDNLERLKNKRKLEDLSKKRRKDGI